MTLSGGSPRAIVDSVLAGDFAPDGQSLALLRFDAQHSLLEYPQGHVILASNTGLTYPRVSPDGRGVACLENPVPGDDRGHVLLVDRNGKARVLTQDFESIEGLAWSADGREIWFSAAQNGIHRSLWSVHPGRPARERLSAPTGLVLMDIARNGDALIMRETVRNTIHGRMAGDPAERDLSWFDFSVVDAISPDGRVMLFDEESEGAGPMYAACMRRAEDAGPVRLGDGIPVALSPDGAWVLSFVPTTPQKLMLLPTGPGQPRPVNLGTLSYVVPAGTWASDGRRILVCGSPAGQPPRLWWLDTGGAAPVPASPPGYQFSARAQSRIAPDGRRVLCSNAAGRLVILDLADHTEQPFPGSTDGLHLVRWTTDGKGFIVFVRGTDRAPVILCDLATGARRTLFEIPHAAADNLLSLSLTDDLKSYAYSTSQLLDDLYLMRGLH